MRNRFGMVSPRSCERSSSGAVLTSERIWFSAPEDAVAQLSQALVEAGALIRVLTPQTATLEDLFFTLTEGTDGHEPAEDSAHPAGPDRATEVVG